MGCVPGRRKEVGLTRENTQWKDLYREVVTAGLCTGCAACVMVCPRDVLRYDHTDSYKPYNIDPETPADDCIHGQRGCDICTRACPRFRAWEMEADTALFGRPRDPREVFGVYRRLLLARATDPEVLAVAQDGGLVSALLLFGLETGRIEGALTSRLSSERIWDAEPFLATTREEVLAAAGSRYTYSANPLAALEAEERGVKRLALVGMGCQASINGTLSARNVARWRKRIVLTLGLLCSKSFTYDLMTKKIQEEMGIPLEDVAKVNIKGKFILWRRSSGNRVDIPLKACYPYTREGCNSCPDFSAEHADISAGGLGHSDGWTVTIVRTENGEEWIRAASEAGYLELRPGEEDPHAWEMVAKLAAKQRERWPVKEGEASRPGLASSQGG